MMWSDENSVSVVPLSRITTPPSTQITAGCNWTVKGFEGSFSLVVAVGVKEEMVGLEEDFIASATPNETKAKLKDAAAVEPLQQRPIRQQKEVPV